MPDIELGLAYYAEVVGLVEVERTAEPAAYLKGWDEHQHHSIVLDQGADLRPRRPRVQGRGGRGSRRAGGAHRGGRRRRHPPRPGELGPGSGTTLRFRAPSGHAVELVHGMAQVGNGMPSLNPPIGPDGLVGTHPPRIDHIFLMCEDVNGATDFFRDVLDFRMTEQILADDGYQLASFLERSHSTHDIAFLYRAGRRFPPRRLLGRRLERAAPRRRHVRLPRHHGRRRADPPRRDTGCGLYFFDPAGNRNELYTGGYWFDPDDEPTTWTESEIGRAIFYYQGKLNPRLMTVHDGALMS